VQLPGTVQAEEVVWLIETLVALYYGFRAVRQAKNDRDNYFRLGANGRGLLLVNSGWRDARIFMAIQIGFFFIAILTLSRTPAPEATVFTRALAVAIFLLMQLGLTVIMRGITHDRSEFVHLTLSETSFDRRTSDSLARIEAAGDKAALAAEKVASELEGSQGRADATSGVPGEAADAASKSRPNDET
jgi:hypothetical protein